MACGDALPQAHRRLAMGMDVGGESGGAMATPNVVPLTDILLVLIIIFMVITPLTPKRLDTVVLQPSPTHHQNDVFGNKPYIAQLPNPRTPTLPHKTPLTPRPPHPLPHTSLAHS